MGPSLPASRILALVGGLSLVAAFFMPWFSSQGLLLSGHFLHTFLTTAGPADLRRFLPSGSQSAQLQLRVLVDLFPTSGAIAAVFALLGRINHAYWRSVADVVLGLSGLIPLIAWSVGIAQLPSGAAPEVGLWLLPLGSIGVLLGLGLEILGRRRVRVTAR